MEKTLELVFNKSDGTKKTLSIADPPCRRNPSRRSGCRCQNH